MIRQNGPVVIARVAADETRLAFRAPDGATRLVSLPDDVARELALDLGRLLGLYVYPRRRDEAG